MEEITMIYLENNDADYCKSCKKVKNTHKFCLFFYDQISPSFRFFKTISKASHLRHVFFVIILSIVCRWFKQKSYHNLLENLSIMAHWLCYTPFYLFHQTIYDLQISFLLPPLSRSRPPFTFPTEFLIQIFSLNFHNFLTPNFAFN